MDRFKQQVLLALAMVLAVGCSGMSGGVSSGGDNKRSQVAETAKYAASIRVLPYVDERKLSDPRKIGVGAENLTGLGGLKGTDILLEQDVATFVTGAMKKRLDGAGYQVVDAGNSNAMFEMSGVLKELTYNVKVRDEVFIAMETTLKEIATGKVIWSGLVTEKADRFAGISGNSMDDVVGYLKKEVGIVTQKTSDAISAVLMAQRPELFNLIPGTKPIPGVTVLSAPAVSAAPPTMPAVSAAPIAIPQAAYTPHASATKGLLVVNTEPSRAKVYVDNVYYGLSPLRLEMDPGVRTVTVKLDGYKKTSEKVSIRKGDDTEVELKLGR